MEYQQMKSKYQGNHLSNTKAFSYSQSSYHQIVDNKNIFWNNPEIITSRYPNKIAKCKEFHLNLKVHISNAETLKLCINMKF